jgi:hypothetical protein
VVAAGGLVAVGTTSALASPTAAPQVVNVVGDGSSVHLSKNTVSAGTIRFNVSSSVPGESGSSEITMFKPKGGATAATVLADLEDEFTGYPSIAAKGTRELVRDATFLGLADPIQGTPFTITESVPAGKYYVLDAGLQPPTSVADLSTLTVTSGHPGAQPAVASQFTVKMTSDDTFVAPRNWSHRGTVTVANVSDTLHFMDLEPVKPGTTDRQVQAFFDSGSQSQPPWSLDGPYGGSDVQSPGTSLQLTYNLPAGTYVLLCFVADDQTGMPHALMGMHKVVVLH